MVKGIFQFKMPAFMKRRKSSKSKKDSRKEESTGPLSESAPSSAPRPCRRGQRYRTISDVSDSSMASSPNTVVPKKNVRRVRTISGSSGYSCQSEPSSLGQRRTRVRTISGGSNFSGDSIVNHLDKLSERDQFWFQAYRFGGR